MASDILDKIAKILNQAENASTEAEATTYFEQAQRMGTKYSIELATARAHISKLQDREQPVVETIQIGESGQHNLAVFCELFMAIGRPNGLKFNIAHNSSYVVAFGMPSDIEMTKALYASIVQQMMQMCNEFIRGGTWRNELTQRWNKRTYEWETKRVDSRVVKRNFYEMFSRRIGTRISAARWEAQQKLVEETTETEEFFGLDDLADRGLNTEGKTGTELVLMAKELEVSDFYKQKSTARGSWKGSSSTYTSNSGRNAGRAAGDRASLNGGRSLPGGRTAIG